ncbi:hypothetical protein EPD20_09110, partial [Campylobacter jejuni]|nr:hypothetical protein [Campylobacter jejuni]
MDITFLWFHLAILNIFYNDYKMRLNTNIQHDKNLDKYLPTLYESKHCNGDNESYLGEKLAD